MRFTFSAFAALALLSFPVLAHATPMVEFEITGINLYPFPTEPFGAPVDITFMLRQMPTDLGNISISGFTYEDPFVVTRNGLDSIADGVYFYSALNGGGATVYIAGSDGEPFFDYGGDQFYSGPETAPVFLPGTYYIYGSGAEKLVITDVGMTAAPEPASLALLGTGALAAFGVARRRMIS